MDVDGLPFVDEASLWVNVRVHTFGGRHLVAFGTGGGLLRVDRRT